MFSFRNVLKINFLLLVITCFFSCNKDSDLLSEYALDDKNFNDAILIRDDIFRTNGNSIILDVLSNDSFPDSTTVRITGISNPNLGTVYIREDNTIVYTPNGNETESASDDADFETESETDNDDEGSENDSSAEDSSETNNDTSNSESDSSSEDSSETSNDTSNSESDSSSEDSSETNNNTSNSESDSSSEDSSETNNDTSNSESDSSSEDSSETSNDSSNSESDTSSSEDNSSSETGAEENTDTTTEESSEENSETNNDSNSSNNTEEDSETSDNHDTETTEETESTTESDTFTYTTETENADGTTTTEEGTVTVEHGEEEEEEVSSEETEEEETVEEAEEEATSSEDTEEPTQNYSIAENARFVSISGNSANDGLSENTSWSIEHAFSTVRAGQTVYVKAGNYGNKVLILRYSGTNESPIRFIGYQNQPEDVKAENGSTFNYGDSLAPNKMPYFEGSAPDGRGTGIAMRIDGDFVELSNLQFSRYEMGIINNSNNVTYDNIVIYKVGDFRANVSGFSDYSGVGIRASGSRNIITNTTVLNAGAEGLILNNCSDCEISNSLVYSDDEVNPTDYYMLMTNGTKNSKIVNSIANRRATLSHFGHGIILKGGANNNTVQNSTVINTNIELSFGDVYENTVTNCAIIGRWSQEGDFGGGLLLANGAHHNTFQNISINNVYGAIRFQDWEDGTRSTNDYKDAGNNNKFTDIIVTGAQYGIDFNEFEKNEASAWDNTFTNCQFKNLNYLFNVNRPNSGNKVSGCTIENTELFSSTSSDYNYQLNSNTIFENNTYTNVGFTRRD